MHQYGIIAIHGGRIEPETSEIVKKMARTDFLLYVDDQNDHISSSNFDNDEVYEFLSKVSTVVSIHGQKDTEHSFVMIGGLDKELSGRIRGSLQESGFVIETPPENLDGDNPYNICNRGVSGKGVQLEISRKLRDQLVSDDSLMEGFCGAIRRVLV